MINRKWMIIPVVALLLLSSFGFGAEANPKINATIARDMFFKLDDEAWAPKDEDGSMLSPIIYNGRSYVPARALLVAFGIDVGYDSKSRTILLKRYGKSTPLLYQSIVSEDKPTVIEYNLDNAELFGTPKLTQETTVEVAENVQIWIDGKKSEKSLAELARLESQEVKFSRIEMSKSTGLVTKIEYVTLPDEEAASRKASIEIEISGPPFKIKITIRF